MTHEFTEFCVCVYVFLPLVARHPETHRPLFCPVLTTQKALVSNRKVQISLEIVLKKLPGSFLLSPGPNFTYLSCTSPFIQTTLEGHHFSIYKVPETYRDVLQIKKCPIASLFPENQFQRSRWCHGPLGVYLTSTIKRSYMNLWLSPPLTLSRKN